MNTQKMKVKSDFKRLTEFAGKRKILIYFSVIGSFLSALVALLPLIYIFFIIRDVINVAPNFEEATMIGHYAKMAVLFSVVTMIVYFGALMCSHLAAFRIGSAIKRMLLKHITKLPVGFYDEMGSGRVRKIIADTSGAAETYLAHNMPDMAGAIATPIGMVAIMFIIDWKFGLVSILPIILALLSMMKMIGPVMQESMRKYTDALEDMNNEAVEYVRGIPVVKTFGQTVYSFSKFKKSIDNYGKFCIGYTKQCRPAMIMFLTFINSAFAFLIVLALILTNGGSSVTADVTLNFIFYVIFTPIITTTLMRVMYMADGAMQVKDALKRIDDIMELKPFGNEKQNDNHIAEKLAQNGYDVSFENVSFSYENSNVQALENVSFTAEKGKVLALVGPSGGGKSTIAGLISRFWDVTEGSIKIGGVDVKEIDKETLMNTISYVFQDSRLIKKSIYENVKLGKPDASREEVLAALKDAKCEDILEKLKDGIDTVIGTKGVYLSGGEMQRIAIARAFLKDAPVVVLDEATAFADPENEYLVQQSFAKLAKNKTVIMIAHRLTTIQNADKIIVMNRGKTVEIGNHKELINKGGLYKKLWDEYGTTIEWKVGGISA